MIVLTSRVIQHDLVAYSSHACRFRRTNPPIANRPVPNNTIDAGSGLGITFDEPVSADPCAEVFNSKFSRVHGETDIVQLMFCVISVTNAADPLKVLVNAELPLTDKPVIIPFR